MTKILIERAVVEQALEALTPFVRGSWTPGLAVQAAAAMDRLKAALAEPQEPVLTVDALRVEFERRYRGNLGITRVEGGAYLSPAIETEWQQFVRKHTTSPQRKPLAEWQINDLMADIDPEDRDSWSFRQGVYAAEKHHGVRK